MIIRYDDKPCISELPRGWILPVERKVKYKRNFYKPRWVRELLFFKTKKEMDKVFDRLSDDMYEEFEYLEGKLRSMKKDERKKSMVKKRCTSKNCKNTVECRDVLEKNPLCDKCRLNGGK